MTKNIIHVTLIAFGTLQAVAIAVNTNHPNIAILLFLSFIINLVYLGKLGII
jgi:hypothetical protein